MDEPQPLDKLDVALFCGMVIAGVVAVWVVVRHA